MRLVFMQRFLILAGALALSSAVVQAQTDVGLSVYGAFSGTTNGNGTVQSPSNAAGGMVEVRHIRNPIVGFEATYSFNRANQHYAAGSFACPVGATPPCEPPPSASVAANAHEITADWIASVKLAQFRPYALAGVGALFDAPSSGQSETGSTKKPVFVYGAGMDWGLLPHLGVRFQYRGNLYKAPDLTKLYTSTGAFAHTAEPMVGVYLRL